MDQINILVVDDEKEIADLVEIYLVSDGYKVFKANNALDGLEILEKEEIHLVLLDIMMPGMDGLEMCRKIRETNNIPIIMLSAKSTDLDKILGLEYGADDYITKPFGTSELLARIRTAIRHSRAAFLNQGGAPTGTFVSGGLTIDYDKHRVFVDGTDAGLTQNEYKIVSLLGKYAGKVMTYDSIIKEIWGPNMKNDNRILRVNMANIRRKIEKNPAEPQYIFTEVGVGYRIVEPD